MSTRGLHVLITGASRGLGAALGAGLAARGAHVALVARHCEPLDQVCRDITERGGVAHAIVADVSAKDDTYAIVGAVSAVLGHIDVLVNNASDLGPVPLRLLADTACEDLERAFATNVVGTFRLTKAVVGPMLFRRSGLVVHVSSDASVHAYPRWGAYGASKAAGDHLARTWAAELEGTGVRFFGVDPGEMDTAMHHAAVPDADRSTLASPASVARIIAGIIERPPSHAGEVVAASSWRPA